MLARSRILAPRASRITCRYFSITLIPRQEPKDVKTPTSVVEEQPREVAGEVISGAPAELSTNRVVRIYQLSKPATQSGTWGSHVWRIDWDILSKANKWENDLMGWASSGDYM